MSQASDHEIVVEPAQIIDADAVLKLCYLAYQSEAALYEDWTIPPLRETYAEVVSALQAGVVLVARLHGEVAGAVRGRNRGGVVEIGRLVVHPRLERQGIGSRLLGAIEEQFPTEPCYELFTGDRSMGNLRLYARHGYREIRRDAISSTLTVVVMQKRRP